MREGVARITRTISLGIRLRLRQRLVTRLPVSELCTFCFPNTRRPFASERCRMTLLRMRRNTLLFFFSPKVARLGPRRRQLCRPLTRSFDVLWPACNTPRNRTSGYYCSSFASCFSKMAFKSFPSDVRIMLFFENARFLLIFLFVDHFGNKSISINCIHYGRTIHEVCNRKCEIALSTCTCMYSFKFKTTLYVL